MEMAKLLIGIFTRCHILYPLKEPCPQGLRHSICHGCIIWEKMRILLSHLIFTLPGKDRTSLRVPAYLDNRNTALLKTFDLPVHDLDGFFNEVEFVVDLDLIQRYSDAVVVRLQQEVLQLPRQST
ncbi:hypothetical protein Tco_1094591 [Tanacetum coccineum]|uniref:Uncharacterized protein n=1 Tax=Tanacetum coccineum TaxID=301880 RepID=A0ABQ5IG58_9ASTR